MPFELKIKKLKFDKNKENIYGVKRKRCNELFHTKTYVNRLRLGKSCEGELSLRYQLILVSKQL